MFWRTFLALTLSTGALVADEALVLTVERAIERALSANEQLIGAHEGLERARMGKELADGMFDLGWTPNSQVRMCERGTSVGTGVVLSRKLPWGTAIGCAPSVGRGRGFYTGGVALTLSQPLFRGRDREHNESPIRAAEFGLRSSERSLRMAEARTALAVVRALYTVGKREAIVELEQASVERLEQFLRATRLKGRVGVASNMDLYRAEIEWRNGVEGRDVALRALEDACEELCRLLALPEGTPVNVEAALAEEFVEVDGEVVLQRALANRFELLQAFERIEDQRRQARAAKHRLLPDLNLDCAVGCQNYGDNWQNDWAIGLTTNTSWDRKAEQVAYATARMSLGAAMRELDASREMIRREVKRAVRSLEHTQKRMGVGREKLTNAEGKLRLSQLRMRRGLANAYDVLQSEIGYKEAQKALVETVIEHTVGHYELLAAQGLLL